MCVCVCVCVRVCVCVCVSPQACKADVQQMCAGVDPNDTGAVHECLRKSRDHLSPDCKAAQDRLETMEHEDVRLNPRIQK